jgi:SAM-dependent methyltransferase
VCGGRWRSFEPAWNRPGAICPRCGAHERHRALWLFLTRDRPELLRESSSLLHFAPEHALERNLRRVDGLRYVTTDLDPDKGELQLDLTALELADSSFAAVLCSHVLEHVPDDAAAMSELHRITRDWCIVMVPQDGREDTYEDWSITTPQARAEHFWQDDHVRIYGNDIVGRLEHAGFAVEVAVPARTHDARRFGLLEQDRVYLCRRGGHDAQRTEDEDRDRGRAARPGGRPAPDGPRG